jgi:hypothetical protein
MKIKDWSLFAEALRRTLIQHYPSLIWQVVPYADTAARLYRGASGVVVRVRRNGNTREIQIAAATIIHAALLSDVVDMIYKEAERLLSSL